MWKVSWWLVSGRSHGGQYVEGVMVACKWKESWWLVMEGVMEASMWKESWWLVSGRSHGGL